MKEDLKRIFFMGLGLMSETGDIIEEEKNKLFKKGEELYNKGLIANEELKHNLKEKLEPEENTKKATKSSILKDIATLSDKDKESLINELTKGKAA